MNRFRKIQIFVICIVMLATMCPFAQGAFAAEESEETYSIHVAQTAGGTVQTEKSTVTESEAADGVRITVTPSKGYGISAIKVNGREPDSTVKGPQASGASFVWIIYPKEDTTVQIIFRKSGGYVFYYAGCGTLR